MQKIAIVTLYSDNNIGNKLQNFAVQEILKKRGLEPRTIISELEEKQSVLNSRKIKLFLIDLFIFIGIKGKKLERYALDKRRESRFKRFSQDYLTLGEKIDIYEIDPSFSKSYDYFIVGSDQVWHNWTETTEEMEFFFLLFAEENKRMCISPSFGLNEIADTYKDIYRKGLKGFRKLSCREESGVALIRELADKEAELLIDPTMMLSEKEWLLLARRPEYHLENNYLLIYLLGNESEEHREIIRDIAENNNLQIVDITNPAEKAHYLTEPGEFIYLIKNARLVCTDSFHGCVFSILFHRNFLCFKREGSNAENMENRLLTLLKKFGLESRFYEHSFSDDLFAAVFEEADIVLKRERKKFDRYLYELFK